jgi:hypothetical protein
VPAKARVLVRLRVREAGYSTRQRAWPLRSTAGPCQDLCPTGQPSQTRRAAEDGNKASPAQGLLPILSNLSILSIVSMVGAGRDTRLRALDLSTAAGLAWVSTAQRSPRQRPARSGRKAFHGHWACS